MNLTSTQTHVPLYDQLTLFGAALFDPADIIEVRLIHRDKGREAPPAQSRWCLPNDLPEMADELAERNADGFGIYAGANPRKDFGSKGDLGVLKARTLFADFDATDIDDAVDRIQIARLPAPTLVVSSGHGIHTYWRLSIAVLNLPAWSNIQRDLIAALGSDPTIHNPERVMRLPGFLNNKRDPAVTCEIVSCDCTRWHEWLTLRTVLPDRRLREPINVTISEPRAQIGIGRASDAEIARRCLDAIGSSRVDDYAEWLAVGMALHSANESLLPDWEAWSRTGSKYVPGECERKWRSFKRAGGTRCTMGTLVHWARQSGVDVYAPTGKRVAA